MQNPGHLRNRYNERGYWVSCILLDGRLLANRFCPDPSTPVFGPSSAYIPLGSIHFLPSTLFLPFQTDLFNLGYTHAQLQVGNVENSKYYLILGIWLCYPAHDANIAISNENETINNTDNSNTESHVKSKLIKGPLVHLRRHHSLMTSKWSTIQAVDLHLDSLDLMSTKAISRILIVSTFQLIQSHGNLFVLVLILS